MATSGKTATTPILVDQILRTAVQMTGLKAETLTPQNWIDAKDTLYRFLLDLSNKGVNLWKIEKQIFGFIPDQSVYTMPNGTVDELECYYRRVTRATQGGSASSGNAGFAFDDDIDTACTQISPDGYISYTFAQQTSVTTLGIMSNGDNYYSLVYEWSNDFVTWNAIYTPTARTLYPDRQWVLQDIDAPRSALFWRVRETGGDTLDIRQVMFGFNPSDIVIQRCSLDTYSSLVNKRQSNQQPNMYWFDRQRVAPVLHLWPVPNYAFDMLVVEYHAHIEEVGAMTDELDIPLRWQRSILTHLAIDLMVVMPGTDMSRMPYLQSLADTTEMTAGNEERDNSPITITPGISGYTR